MDANGLRLVPPHSTPGLFALGLLFAAADAFGIGSNDVANAFATSVGSRSLTLRAACSIAVVTEFSGAMFLGSHVTKTIKGALSLARMREGGALAPVLCMLSGWSDSATDAREHQGTS